MFPGHILRIHRGAGKAEVVFNCPECGKRIVFTYFLTNLEGAGVSARCISCRQTCLIKKVDQEIRVIPLLT